MLALRQLSANYDGAIVALDHVDASVGAGRIVALLGANGAGKTTLLKAIAGMLPFDRGDIVGGDILFEDSSLLGRHPAEISRRGIALVQDGRQCFRQLTVAENLHAASFAHPKGAAERLERVQGYFPFLREMRDRKAGLLSGGQLQMLVIGMAIMCNPRLLMLDEPSLGLSPVMVQSVFDAIERMHRELKMTIVVAEQTVPRLLKIASDAYVLSRGRIVMHAPPSEMTEEELQKVYLN
ncbi:ABC transporter ATP-binding protein [Bradyrhizobium sp. SSBR45G]|uniref:ABC transporter ATP-binding protein n=1 Tax=unclassified Bradyrhizobium TaxID=2631580 RepID=UPI002342AC97|nr:MULTISPECIES: ABC transporter ATP-binding protein [unclassified Bradyrhizobium]GLH79790.1 ABC transporter ATP-binding protein [Bradyrhizobium sp. SSBR45G]GLH87091.1 ABC transporter ATP-binding protein [Bradyrhizobium sp. SSBR45R]